MSRGDNRRTCRPLLFGSQGIRRRGGVSFWRGRFRVNTHCRKSSPVFCPTPSPKTTREKKEKGGRSRAYTNRTSGTYLCRRSRDVYHNRRGRSDHWWHRSLCMTKTFRKCLGWSKKNYWIRRGVSCVRKSPFRIPLRDLTLGNRPRFMHTLVYVCVDTHTDI